MSKNKKPILFDDIEWGNQELPNLSHDEIMNKNWQYVKTGRDYEKWKESIDNRTANEQWRKNVAKGNQNKEKQKEFVKKRQIGIDKRTASHEWQVANAKAVAKRHKDPKWWSKNFEAAQKRAKPVRVPWGEYESIRQASEVSLEKTGIHRNRTYIKNRILGKVKNIDGIYEYIND